MTQFFRPFGFLSSSLLSIKFLYVFVFIAENSLIIFLSSLSFIHRATFLLFPVIICLILNLKFKLIEINSHPNESNQGLHGYPFVNKLDKYLVSWKKM